MKCTRPFLFKAKKETEKTPARKGNRPVTKIRRVTNPSLCVIYDAENEILGETLQMRKMRAL